MVPNRQTLIEMGWPQPPSPVQTDNSTAVGIINKTIVPRHIKSMDMRFYWLDAAKPKANSIGTGPLDLDPPTKVITVLKCTRQSTTWPNASNHTSYEAITGHTLHDSILNFRPAKVTIWLIYSY